MNHRVVRFSIRTLALGVAIVAVLGGLDLASTAFGQGKELFTAVQRPTNQLAANQQRALAKLQAGKGLTFIKLIGVNKDLLGKDALNLDLAPGVRLRSGKGIVDRRAANKLVWTSPMATSDSRAVLVANGDNVTGTISTANGVYQIRPLGGGVHAVIKLDYAKLPADHPPSFGAVEKRDAKQADLAAVPFEISAARVSAARLISVPTIRVLVAYTPAVAADVADVEGLIDLAIAETNQSYTNSQIHARLTLVDQYQTSYTETGDWDRDLTRFRTPGDGFMDEVHTHRSNHCADVAVLILENWSACGLASTIMATPATAFAAVHYDCATGYYSFGHEIGHLQGARHNPETDGTNTPYSYGHGLRHGPQFRTVMAYNCPGDCPRRDYWSNPNVSLFGFPTGTAANNDNHRVLNTTASTVAAFKSTVPCMRIVWTKYKYLTELCALVGCGAKIRGAEEHVTPSIELTRAMKQGGATGAQALKLRKQAGDLFLKADGASDAQIAQIEKDAAALEAQFNKLLKLKKVAPLAPVRRQPGD